MGVTLLSNTLCEKLRRNSRGSLLRHGTQQWACQGWMFLLCSWWLITDCWWLMIDCSQAHQAAQVSDEWLFTFSIQSLQHAHHSQILGGWCFDSLHRTIEIEGEAGGKGVANFLRHQHVPLAFCVVTICQYNIVFLQNVVCLALLSDNIGVIVALIFHCGEKS